MKERRLINEETGCDMQNWYIEKLGEAVKYAANLKDHILNLGNITYHTRSNLGTYSTYEMYGIYSKMRDEFDQLVKYLLTAYEFSYGCDKSDGSLMMLKLLKEHGFDPIAVFEEDEKIHKAAHKSDNDEMAQDDDSTYTFDKWYKDNIEYCRKVLIDEEKKKNPKIPEDEIEKLVDIELETIKSKFSVDDDEN